jgi:division protein CdvB (Snf7/Vps24/ESCRT-III family)
MERFFQEVEESSGQCLNGNMARLMNVFSAIDLEMSPQQIGLPIEQVHFLISKSVNEASCLEEAIEQVKMILLEGGIDKNKWDEWLNEVKNLFQ